MTALAWTFLAGFAVALVLLVIALAAIDDLHAENRRLRRAVAHTSGRPSTRKAR